MGWHYCINQNHLSKDQMCHVNYKRKQSIVMWTTHWIYHRKVRIKFTEVNMNVSIDVHCITWNANIFYNGDRLRYISCHITRTNSYTLLGTGCHSRRMLNANHMKLCEMCESFFSSSAHEMLILVCHARIPFCHQNAIQC